MRRRTSGGCRATRLAAAKVDLRAEVLPPRLARTRVQAVGGDDEVELLRERGRVVGPGLVPEVDAEAGGPFLEKLEESVPPDAAEPVPRRHDALAPDADRDVVPVREVAVDRGRAHRVVGGEVAQRLVGEDHPQPKVSSGALRSNTVIS